MSRDLYVDDGGPAFPSGKIDIGSEWTDWPHLGMTLREWFAGRALGAFRFHGSVLHQEDCETLALAAYAIADAMLKQGQKE